MSEGPAVNKSDWVRIECPWCHSKTGIEAKRNAPKGWANPTRCHSCGGEALVMTAEKDGQKGWITQRRTSKTDEFPKEFSTRSDEK